MPNPRPPPNAWGTTPAPTDDIDYVKIEKVPDPNESTPNTYWKDLKYPPRIW